MPNWCDCELAIEGSEEELKKFKKFAKSKKELLDIQKFIPYPKKFKEKDEFMSKLSLMKSKLNDLKDEKKIKRLQNKINKLEIINGLSNGEDGYNNGGYDWCVQNWGTKWGICSSKIILERCGYCEKHGLYFNRCNELIYGFETAWNPPLPIILKMSKMFKKLEFELRYFEAGSGFNGLFKCKGGKIIENLTGDYFGMRGG